MCRARRKSGRRCARGRAHSDGVPAVTDALDKEVAGEGAYIPIRNRDVCSPGQRHGGTGGSAIPPIGYEMSGFVLLGQRGIAALAGDGFCR